MIRGQKNNKKTVIKIHYMAKINAHLETQIQSPSVSASAPGFDCSLCEESLEVLAGHGCRFKPSIDTHTGNPYLPREACWSQFRIYYYLDFTFLILFEFPFASCIFYVIHSVRR